MDAASLPTLRRLASLELIEQRILELLRIATAVTGMLNGQTSTTKEAAGRSMDDTPLTAMETQCDRYYELLENIQVMLRQQFRHLTDAGITDADAIFRTPVAGLEKDHMLWQAGIAQLRAEVQQTRQLLDAATSEPAP
ncbi:hypothetical protein SYNPS1DRAFT_30564 [Syncephalis pseudoplumigaleata]|uniref:Mediator of RNA polymerase II transcription subunit 11 n=1 Tax=Syncephalis pseudoplumigaleata TaxID=1712513 RepID=A0A4P9YUH7_9FUNG|nr:hypothetical protein SYNPS1DRAFT_30564 [Syncephalis pseudoplumigaleata]|eukprot:RKP23683.1 hypothetical protein SYNPS1DRAFT_30564 [Syncephalis pseudoplumigaleata]